MGMPNYVAFRFATVPFAVETCDYMGMEVVRLVKRIGNIAAKSGHARSCKGKFLRSINALGNAAAVGVAQRELGTT